MASEILVMARGDFLSVEALYQGITKIRQEQWQCVEALLTIGGTLELALGKLTIYDPSTGAPLPPRAALKYARQVGAHFKRAAVGPGLVSGELDAAWKSFDKNFKQPAEQAARVPPTQPGGNFTGLPAPGAKGQGWQGQRAS
jgi:hypothetical protein